MRFLKKLLTSREQKALLLLCGLTVLGLVAGRVTGVKGPIPVIQKDIATPEILAVAAKEDKPVQIDIRTASKEELILLPGIGEKRAQEIIDHRSRKPFKNTDDLLEIKGIGEKTLAKMLPSLVQFGSPQFSAPPEADPNAMTSIGLVPLSPDAPAKEAKPKSRSTEAKAPAIPKTQLNNIVNLNTAGLANLCTLPGIGEVKAQAIIDYRSENGKFQTIDDIVKVKGIGAKTLEKIRHRLSV